MNIFWDFLPFLLASIITILLVIWGKLFCNKYLIIVIIGFSVRLLLIVIHENTRVFGEADINDFLPYFEEFSKVWDKDLSGFLKPHAPFYTFLYAGWIFNVVGESGLWTMRMISAALGVATIAPLNGINRLVFGKNLSGYQAFIVTLWPTWMFHSRDVGRTSISVLLVLLSIYGLLGILASSKAQVSPKIKVFTLLYLFLAVFIRIHYLAYFIPILFFSLLAQVNKSNISPYIRPILYFIFSVFGFLLIIFITTIYQQLSQETYGLSAVGSQEDAVSFIKGGEWGGSVYLEGIYPNTFLDWIWYLPLHAFYFMFSPMPWDIHNAFVAGSSVQSLILLFFCYKSWHLGIKLLKSNEMLKLLLLIILFASLSLGAGVKNAGSAERWRLPSTLILITTTTSIMEYSKNKKIKYITC
jgi:hypothetical protein